MVLSNSAGQMSGLLLLLSAVRIENDNARMRYFVYKVYCNSRSGLPQGEAHGDGYDLFPESPSNGSDSQISARCHFFFSQTFAVVKLAEWYPILCGEASHLGFMYVGGKSYQGISLSLPSTKGFSFLHSGRELTLLHMVFAKAMPLSRRATLTRVRGVEYRAFEPLSLDATSSPR